MSLSTVLPLDHIRVPLAAADRIAAIDELLDGLQAAQGLPAALHDTVRTAVLAREDELTTGIGGGVAIPHARVAGIETPLLALGIAPGGLDFGAIDGSAVHLVFLLVSGAEQTGPHLALLSELCGLLNDADRRGRLARCLTAADALAVLS